MGVSERTTSAVGMKAERVPNAMAADVVSSSVVAQEPEQETHDNNKNNHHHSTSTTSTSTQTNGTSDNKPMSDAELKAQTRMASSGGAGTKMAAATTGTTSSKTPGTTTLQEQLQARTLQMERKVRGSAGATARNANRTSMAALEGRVVPQQQQKNPPPPPPPASASTTTATTTDSSTDRAVDNARRASGSAGGDGTTTTLLRLSSRTGENGNGGGDVAVVSDPSSWGRQNQLGASTGDATSSYHGGAREHADSFIGTSTETTTTTAAGGIGAAATSSSERASRASRRTRKNGAVPASAAAASGDGTSGAPMMTMTTTLVHPLSRSSLPPASLSASEAAARKKMMAANGGSSSSGTSGSTTTKNGGDAVSVSESMAHTVESASGLVVTARGGVGVGIPEKSDSLTQTTASQQQQQDPNPNRDVIPVTMEPGAYRVSSSMASNANVNDDNLMEGQESTPPVLGAAAPPAAAASSPSQKDTSLGGVWNAAGVAVGVAAGAGLVESAPTTATAKDKMEMEGTVVAELDDNEIVAGAVHAQAIDEADLEQQYRDQFLRDVTVEAAEVKMDEEEAERARKARQRFWMCVCIVIAGLAVGLGLGLGLKKDVPETAPPTPAPTLSESEALYELVLPWSSADSLEDPASPQAKAYNWVLNEDPADLTYGLVDGSTNSSTILERYVMATLYYSTDGPNWSNQLDFLTNTSVCDWPDESTTASISTVNCNDQGELFDVRIDSNNLAGTIPSELAALTSLQILSFNDNALVGTLPSELGLLFPTLFWFSMDKNAITGSIPDEIAGLPLLRAFIVWENMLTGTIPPNLLGKDTSVMYAFEVSRNMLTGPLPPLRIQSQMEFFNVQDNRLTGTIHPSIYAQPGMIELLLNNNNFTGTIPEQIDGLKAVEELYFQNNAFSGSLPTRIGNLKKLKELLLHDNALSGSIPDTWSDLRNLESFDVSRNQLTGLFPDGFASAWERIEVINLDSNPLLSGSIPLNFGELTALARFRLQDTDMSSGLEEAFCNQEIFWTSISADCGGDVPQIECSCCTTCCNATSTGDASSCTLNNALQCKARAGSLAIENPARGAVCTCSGDSLVISCNDDASCKSCNGDPQGDDTQCVSNTDYGYILEETTGDIAAYQTTLVHTSGPWTGTEIQFYDDITTEKYEVFVNGTLCRSSFPLACPSNFEGMVVNCDNVDPGFTFNSCEAEESRGDSGYLGILLAYDPAFLEGCPLSIVRVNGPAFWV